MVALAGRPRAGSRRLLVAKESPKSGISIEVRWRDFRGLHDPGSGLLGRARCAGSVL
jgi:hypothetical protein